MQQSNGRFDTVARCSKRQFGQLMLLIDAASFKEAKHDNELAFLNAVFRKLQISNLTLSLKKTEEH